MNDTSAGTFCSFDVSLVRGEDRIYWLSADCTEGALNAVPVQAPDWGVELQPENGPLDWLNTTIRTAAGRVDDGMSIGQALKDMLFGTPEVNELFVRLRAAASVRNQQIVLRLMGAPADVSDWPWELMLDPDNSGIPLILSEDVHLVRTARVRSYPSGKQMVKPPVNVLVIMSSPLPGADQAAHSLDQFDLYEEKRHLLRDLAPMIESGKLSVTLEDRPTLERLSKALRKTESGFHIVHYLGHASEHGLWFEDQNGTGKLVLSKEFSNFLRLSPHLRFVLLAGCETARAPRPLTPGDWEGGLSITQHAVRDAAPAVMGMQVVLPFRTQRIFTRSFYESLTAGYSVARALTLARKQVWDDQKDRVQQLDWAIPTLFLGAEDPDAIVDANAQALPPPQINPVRLHVSQTYKDLRFVARHANLRRVVDVLSNRTKSRLVCIRGENVRSQDLSNLMDRALEELDPSIAQLKFSARDLGEAQKDELLKFLREILRQSNNGKDLLEHAAPSMMRSLIVDRVARIPLAIAIDHAYELKADSPVVEIIRDLLSQRGQVRVALVHREEHNPFTFEMGSIWEPSVVTEMRWSEVWAWIRGQLPELAHKGESQLHPLHSVLGDNLERWEALADRLAGRDAGSRDPNIEAAVRALKPKEQAENSVDDFFSAPAATDDIDAAVPESAQHMRDAITVAVAGPFTEGRDHAFRDAMARFADAHGLAGRVSASPDKRATIVAQTLKIASPFTDGKSATTAALLSWMNKVAQANARVLVLDFGTDHKNMALSNFVEQLAASGVLVVAAGGNTGVPNWPAWSAQTLAVGAMADGHPSAYSIYHPDVDKPDLYAPETLDATPLEGWVEKLGQRGTTFAALYVAAAAALVWASYPTLKAEDVKTILNTTAAGQGPRFINVQRAIDEARSVLVQDILQTGDMELYQIISESGLPMDLAMQTIAILEEAGRIKRKETENGDVLSYPQRIAARYDALRLTPPSYRRTIDQERLMADARELASRRALTDNDAWALWNSGQKGNRIVALAHQFKSVGSNTMAIIEDGILKSQSAFEQYHAMRLAQKWGNRFEGADRGRIVSAIKKELLGDKFDAERHALGSSIIHQLSEE